MDQHHYRTSQHSISRQNGLIFRRLARAKFVPGVADSASNSRRMGQRCDHFWRPFICLCWRVNKELGLLAAVLQVTLAASETAAYRVT